MKKIISLLSAFLILFSSFSFSLAAESVSGTEVLNWRDDFLWGQNLHNNITGYDSPDEYSEERLYLAAQEGVKLIRYGGQELVTQDFTECDRIVGLCNKYGIKVMLVIKPGGYGFDEPTQEDLDFVTKCAKTFAERYNGKNGRGKVDYFQLWNELEIKLMRAKYGASAVSGDLPYHYFDVSVEGKDDLVEWTKVFKAAVKGIKSADTDSKTVINFSWSAFGCVRYYYENGVDFDCIGWDYYPDTFDTAEAVEDFENFLYKGWTDNYDNWHDGLHTVIPDKDIIICESNTYVKGVGDFNTEKLTPEQYEPFLAVARAAYDYPYIKAFCAFQLTDAPSHADISEKYFGFVRVEKGGKIIEPKPIYYQYQSLIGGDSSIERLSKDSVDLKPYEIFKVKTQEDDEFNNEVVDTPIIDTPVMDTPIVDNSSIENNDTSNEIEPIIETVIVKPDDIYNKTTTTITHNKLPWALLVSVGVGMLMLFGAGFATFVIIDKKKAKKNSLLE